MSMAILPLFSVINVECQDANSHENTKSCYDTSNKVDKPVDTSKLTNDSRVIKRRMTIYRKQNNSVSKKLAILFVVIIREPCSLSAYAYRLQQYIKNCLSKFKHNRPKIDRNKYGVVSIKIFSETKYSQFYYTIRRCSECVILVTESRFVFTPVSNPLTLYCDHFDHGADHS